jgi:hypothetical protein
MSYDGLTERGREIREKFIEVIEAIDSFDTYMKTTIGNGLAVPRDVHGISLPTERVANMLYQLQSLVPVAMSLCDDNCERDKMLTAWVRAEMVVASGDMKNRQEAVAKNRGAG